MTEKLAGKIQTVLGSIEPGQLGFTLPHEHILLDCSVRFMLPNESITARINANKKVSLEMLGWLRYHLFENIDNLMMDDEAVLTREVSLFKSSGGKALADMTNWGIGRDPHALVRVSRATGIHIIMGSGYYTMDSGCARALAAKSEDEIYEEIVRDFTVGIDGIRPGVIGEIGADSWPLHDIEIKSLRAAARAQRTTGAALNVHPGRLDESPLQILRVLDKAGADLNHVIMDHLDRTAYSFESMVEIAKTGCYLEFDNFALEGYYPRRYGVFDSPNDAARVNYIIRLIDKGFLRQIFISTDICMKIKLVRYGGPGYAHIPENVIPLMRAKGIREDVINTITVENPKQAFTFANA